MGQSIVVGNQVVDVGIVRFEVGQFSVDLKVVFNGGPIEVTGSSQAGPDSVLFGLKEVELLAGIDSVREFGTEFRSESGTTIQAKLGELVGLRREKSGVHGGYHFEGAQLGGESGGAQEGVSPTGAAAADENFSSHQR